MIESSINSIRILDIKYGTSVDGIGLRTSLYSAGCENRCVGCHNPQSWDENGGEAIAVEELFDRIVDADMNVTFTGGDPMFHPGSFILLAQMIKQHTDKTIWCYTGYRFEDLLAHPLRRKLVELCDVVVDGRYVESERDLSLRFRGSRNQRVIDVAASLKADSVVTLFED
jgi:anaerobic ribonucleoside-triphosphate reductase activating protein